MVIRKILPILRYINKVKEMKKVNVFLWAVLIVILTIKYANAQDVIYSSKKFTVTQQSSHTYNFTYGGKYQYTSTVTTEDKELIEKLIDKSNELLKGKRPGLSGKIIATVDSYKITRNRWNLYIEYTGKELTYKIPTTPVTIKTNSKVSPVYPYGVYIPRYYYPRYSRYSTRIYRTF